MADEACGRATSWQRVAGAGCKVHVRVGAMCWWVIAASCNAVARRCRCTQRYSVARRIVGCRNIKVAGRWVMRGTVNAFDLLLRYVGAAQNFGGSPARAALRSRRAYSSGSLSYNTRSRNAIHSYCPIVSYLPSLWCKILDV